MNRTPDTWYGYLFGPLYYAVGELRKDRSSDHDQDDIGFDTFIFILIFWGYILGTLLLVCGGGWVLFTDDGHKWFGNMDAFWQVLPFVIPVGILMPLCIGRWAARPGPN